MRAAAFGINEKTGRHTRQPLTFEESAFLGILWEDHAGAFHKIAADDLAVLFARKAGGDPSERPRSHNEWKRQVRLMQNHLLCEHNIPILSKAGNDGGYWIAATKDEAEEFYGSFRKRGLTGLVKASRGKQSALVDMVRQLSFEFDELRDHTEQTHRIRPVGGMPTPIEVVDAFLEKMLQDPAKFADGLRKIGQKYGSVLLPRARVEALKAEMARVQELVAALEA